MQVQVNIEFDQLLKIVRTLPTGQLKQLKGEIEREITAGASKALHTNCLVAVSSSVWGLAI